MNEEKTFTEGYAFRATDCTGKQSVFSVNQEVTTWPEMLNDFVSFMSNIYGYDIKKSVSIDPPRYNTEWHGNTFSSTETSDDDLSGY